MGSHAVRADVVRNRLYVKFMGFFNDEEARVACAEVVREARRLTSGFAIITDISEFKPATEAGAAEIRSTQTVLGALGVARIIRVVGPNVIPDMQLTRTAREADYGAGVRAEKAASVEEAEQMLEG